MVSLREENKRGQRESRECEQEEENENTEKMTAWGGMGEKWTRTEGRVINVLTTQSSEF